MVDALREAFEEFVRVHDGTLTPVAFRKWLREHRPAVLAAAGADVAMRFAEQYLGTAISTRLKLPPIVG